MWRDTETLWSHAIDADTTRSTCRGNPDAFLVNLGQLPSAVYHLEHAIERVHGRRGNTAQALVQLVELRRFAPRLAQSLQHALKQVTQ